VRNIALELALLGDKVDIYVNKLIPREEDSVYLHNKYIQQKEDEVSLNKNIKVIRVESKRLPYRDIYDTDEILDISDITDSYLSAQKYKDTLNKYDYVCIFHPLACIGVLLGGFSSPKKTILFPMLLSDEYKKYQKVSNVYCALEQKALEMSKIIFCGSKIEINTLEKRGVDKNKLFLASRGYNNSVFKGIPKTISEIKNKDVVLTCVGSIRSQKNQVQLVQIVKLLNDRNINPIVNIVGDNINFPNPDHKTYYDDMVNMIKQFGLVENFIFCGRLNSKQIAGVLSKTDFAVLTSKAEKFGKADLESICM
jgi:glycosyltransferase involved in cell wall biosynthesis